MLYDLRLRYNFIGDKILVEFQKYIDKLSPAIRTKSIIRRAKLNPIDEEMLVFLRQIGDINPPFTIDKNMFCSVLFDKILQSNFIFIQNSQKSLKRVHTLPFQADNYHLRIIKPIGLNIYVKTFHKDCVQTEIYADYGGIETPLWYDFLLFKDMKLYRPDTTDIINQTHAIVPDITKNLFSYDELSKLKSKFMVLVKTVNNCTKNVSFSQETSGFLSFDKKKINDEYFYTKLLEAYLKNKNYIEYDDQIMVFKETDFTPSVVANIIEESNTDQEYIIEFLEMIKNIKQYPLDDELNILTTLIKTELKSYQTEGVLWLCNLYKNNLFGGLLADDMGLGKTLQTICFLVANNIDSALIVAPASLVQNWRNEILRFTHINIEEISLAIEPSRI